MIKGNLFTLEGKKMILFPHLYPQDDRNDASTETLTPLGEVMEYEPFCPECDEAMDEAA
jgi:hypothetical protein